MREALFVTLLNIAGLTFVVLFHLIFFGWPDQAARRILSAIVFSICILTPVSFVLLRLAPRFAGKRFYVRWPLLIAMIGASAIAGFCLGVFILTGLRIRPLDYRSWLDLPEDILSSLLLAFAFGISGYIYEVVRARLDAATLRLRTTELEKERARKLAAEASLASLESRIHPHFLFNTLNSISGLIREDPTQAERMVERLAALLRFSLDSSARSVISLEQELKIATGYLEIERARFGDRLQYVVEAPPELLSIELPLGALQTLVENSIKHVAARNPGEIFIRIVARREKHYVRLEAHDNGPGFTLAAVAPDHGLDNLRGRLRALFGEDATLDLPGSSDGMSCVRISLPTAPVAKSAPR